MKYIFIDSNQYRHIFSKNEGFSDEIKNLLDKLIDQDRVKLLLPKQVKEEVERNRFENWYNEETKDNTNKIDKINAGLKTIEESLSAYPTELDRIRKRLKKDLVSIEKEASAIKNRYRELRSKANQKLKSLFGKAVFIEEAKEIIEKARFRLEKGNPPNDNKLGDALIWESLLSYLSSAPSKSSLVFVARDGNAWGRDGFNPWLVRELKAKTRVSISLTHALSDIDGLTQEEQERIRQVEITESKNNAISSFENSGSFISAGNNCESLLIYKDMLTEEDYKRIITASITNNQIYESFFTSIPLNRLCKGELGYAVRLVESLPKEIWDNFVKRNIINLLRQGDEQKEQ